MSESPLFAPRPPTAEELQAAPFLWDWAVVLGSAVRLTGTVKDHPDGPTSGPTGIVTSELLDFDPGLTWARTESRYYRLGRPQDPTDLAIALASKWQQARDQAGQALPEGWQEEWLKGWGDSREKSERWLRDNDVEAY